MAKVTKKKATKKKASKKTNPFTKKAKTTTTATEKVY